jgi:hypothetical protein
MVNRLDPELDVALYSPPIQPLMDDLVYISNS